MTKRNPKIGQLIKLKRIAFDAAKESRLTAMVFRGVKFRKFAITALMEAQHHMRMMSAIARKIRYLSAVQQQERRWIE